MEFDFKLIQSKLEEYKANYAKVEAALKQNQEKIQDDLVKSQREKDLQSLLQDIQKGINYHSDLLKTSKSQMENFFSSLKLKPSDCGKKCNVYYEKDQKWYPGEINSVNLSDQTANITFLGFSEGYQVPASFVSILIPPKKSDLKEGLDIEALLSDGKWYFGSIEKLEEFTVTVRLSR
jgi:hypothetical protein